MTKKLLLVGEHLNTEMWKEDLEAKGYDCNEAGTMMQAIDYLKTAEPKPAVLVQSHLPIISMDQLSRTDIPPEFKQAEQKDRGATLIQYARASRLLPQETPAYLAMIGVEEQKAPPEGITKIIDWGMEQSIADQIQPALHRSGSGQYRGKK